MGEAAAELLDGTTHGLDPRVATLWMVLSGSVPIVLGAGGAVALAAADAGTPAVGGALLGGAVLAALAVVWARLSWARWRWSARPHALDLRHGVVIARESLVPYHRIQQIDVVRDPLERILGLSSLVLRTASATTDGKLPGLPAETVDALRLRLLALAGVDDAV